MYASWEVQGGLYLVFYVGGLEEAARGTVSEDVHFQSKDMFKTSLTHDILLSGEENDTIVLFYIHFRDFLSQKLENFLSRFL